MKSYRHRHADTGVVAYHYGDDWIELRFKGGERYRYTAESVGRKHLVAMKRLADSGEGLTTYVNTHPEVKNGYV